MKVFRGEAREVLRGRSKETWSSFEERSGARMRSGWKRNGIHDTYDSQTCDEVHYLGQHGMHGCVIGTS